MRLGPVLSLGTIGFRSNSATSAVTLDAVTLSSTANATVHPDGISGLLAWYEMGLGATVSGGNITALADQSGTGDSNKNLTKQIGNAIPYTTSDAAYNNLPTATFSGNQELTSVGVWASSQSQPLTIYSVGHATNNGGRTVDGAASHRALIARNGASGPWSIFGGTAFLNGTGTDPTVPSKVCGVFNGASSAIYVGTNFATAAGTGSIGTNDITRLCVGALTGGGGELVGKVACILAYSGAHDATTRAKVAAYLGKYGV